MVTALAYQRSYFMSGPLSTGAGDHLWMGKPPLCATSHLGQLSLLPYVG